MDGPLVGDFFLVMLAGPRRPRGVCVCIHPIPGAWVRLQICKDTASIDSWSLVPSSMQSVQLVTSHLESNKTLSTSRPLIRGSGFAAMGSDQVRSGGPFFLFVSITRVWTSALWLVQLRPQPLSKEALSSSSMPCSPRTRRNSIAHRQLRGSV